MKSAVFFAVYGLSHDQVSYIYHADRSLIEQVLINLIKNALGISIIKKEPVTVE